VRRDGVRERGGDALTTSVGEDFPKQQARVRECLKNGREIGPAGAFYVAVCEAALRQADEAAISGDPVAILRAYEEMRSIAE
jgi:hypothetical protein